MMGNTGTPPMTSQRPYVLRALYEWIVDNGMTPHVLVNASVPGVRVPTHVVKDGQVVLNIADRAVGRLQMGNDVLSFSARFGGVSQNVVVPLAAVMAIYARETGQGMALPEDPRLPQAETDGSVEADDAETAMPVSEPSAPASPSDEPPKRGSHLRIIK